MIVYLLWRLATMLARITPPRASYFCAARIADLTFSCWREKREATIDNMAHVLPRAGRATVRRVARQSFRNYARYLVDFIRLPEVRPEDLAGKVDFDGWEAVEAASSEGKGMIFVLMHFGCWDLGGLLLSSRGYAVNVIAETMGHGRLNQMVVSTRTANGTRVIPMENAAIPIIRALRRNEILGILIDRPGAATGIPVNFFGSEAILPAGPARIALRTGARIMPVALARLQGTEGRMLALVEPNVHFERTGDEQNDVRTLTEAVLQAHERFILRFPDQWYMFRQMWRPGALPAAPEPALASDG